MPVVFSSPHSGRDYPAEFVASARLDPLTLRRSEDSFIEELFAAAPGSGAPLLAATFPRVFCDPNREKWELDPAMFADRLPAFVNSSSPRVQAGLGTIARVVSSGEAIYRGRLRFTDAQARVIGCWEPFHAALAALLETTSSQFGACLLIDCHSMPSRVATRLTGRRPDFVLGDAFGTSCAPAIAASVEAILQARGYHVARNDPYAGGYITRTYGKRLGRVQALQIEMARDLYMDEATMTRNGGFGALQESLAVLVTALAAAAPGLLGIES